MTFSSFFRAAITFVSLAITQSSAICDPAPDSPAVTARNYYLAIGSGDLAKVRGFYSVETEKFYASKTPQLRAAMESGKTVTFGDQVTGIDIKNQTQQGEEVWVTVTIHYKTHADANFNTGLVKENGVWKIAPN